MNRNVIYTAIILAGAVCFWLVLWPLTVLLIVVFDLFFENQFLTLVSSYLFYVALFGVGIYFSNKIEDKSVIKNNQ